MRGRVKVENAANGSANFETGSNAKMSLPLNFTFAYAFKPNPKTTIEADLGYTRWSIHERLFINADPVDTANDAILAAIGKNGKDYGDAFSLHLGGNRKVTKKLTLMAGTLFYWTPVPNDHFIPAVPDSNSMAFSVGAEYELVKYLTLGASFFERIWLRRTIDNNISGGGVNGKYFSTDQQVALSMTYKWDNIVGDLFGEKKAATPATA